MAKNNKIIEWSVQNRQIILLLVSVFFVSGAYSLIKMPKQEMPHFTVRYGVVAGVFPGANSRQVEEQLTKPLERYLFTYDEVKRSETTSKSEDGICYVFVELSDNVKDNNVAWSKIRHGIATFRQSLPSGVLAVVVNDNFGDVSSVLVTMESDDKTPRQIDEYCDALEDRLRAVASVANVRRYGSQKEQITVYIDNQKLAAYGVGAKTLAANLFAQGLTTLGGALENSQSVIPVHIAETCRTEQDIADRIIYSAPDGDVVRVKDVGRVVREYPAPDSYISHNGKQCVLLSVEVKPTANIISFGNEVNAVLNSFKQELPASVNINRIVDQPDVVNGQISAFLRELMIAIIAVILVIMILMPFRVSTVSAMSIPITVAVTFTVMYIADIPLNLITLAALMAVLGIIVDDTIVVVDNYIDKLDAGMSRREATVHSVQEYFRSILSATLAISITFFPVLITTSGMLNDFLQHFPWTVCITLVVSLFVGVLVIPVLQYYFIKKGLHAAGKKHRSFLDIVQSVYDRLLEKVFAFPKTALATALTSIAAGTAIFMIIPKRMMPVAERDQFAVEIYLPKGSPLEKTAAIADSMENILRADSRVKSVSSFTGAGSPRFHTFYAPKMPSKSYCQFIVNTVSNRATEKMLDEYTNRYAFYFPEAYVKFKQIDFQMSEAPVEIRLKGDNIEELKTQAQKIEDYLQSLDKCLWVRTSFDAPVQSIAVELNPEEMSRLGVSKALVSLGISAGLSGMKAGDVWEGNYSIPVCIRPENPENTVSGLGDVQISGLYGSSVPLRQIARISPEWNEGVITHRNGIREIIVLADVKRGENVNDFFKQIDRFITSEIAPLLPAGISLDYGGENGQDTTVVNPMLWGMAISFVIIFFILVFHFRKLKLAIIIMSSVALCLFGASFGIWALRINFNVFAILGIIGLAGIIVRNGIIMFDYIEYLRLNKGESVRTAAFEAGKRRMRPIFLTSAVAAMGVLPMVISQSPMWSGMATIIFFGTLITMILIVTVLPVVYWLAYDN
ncbi:MAG: efflux RND transporter permease subunit [Prevotellaceae bacterium]|jgi:multidrug efflux pump subunit AcrB|nr:efflux RND transporter permease subunit [Prevotellaceae bacterium]